VVLIQLCAPRDAVKYFDKVKKDTEDKRFRQMMQGYGLGHGLNTQGDHSSRLNSARGGMNDHFMLSGSITDELENPISPNVMTSKKKPNENDIFSFLSSNGANTEEFRQAL
jgi:hypothetical protein